LAGLGWGIEATGLPGLLGVDTPTLRNRDSCGYLPPPGLLKKLRSQGADNSEYQEQLIGEPLIGVDDDLEPELPAGGKGTVNFMNLARAYGLASGYCSYVTVGSEPT
jgi:hypothetical protein